MWQRRHFVIHKNNNGERTMSISEAVIKEVEEKAAKESRSIASVLKERGIKVGRFYGAKRRLQEKSAKISPPVVIIKSEKKEIPLTQMSLLETLDSLQFAIQNLERIFRGHKQ